MDLISVMLVAVSIVILCIVFLNERNTRKELMVNACVLMVLNIIVMLLVILMYKNLDYVYNVEYEEKENIIEIVTDIDTSHTNRNSMLICEIIVQYRKQLFMRNDGKIVIHEPKPCRYISKYAVSDILSRVKNGIK